jgi:hypothetical protein
MEGNGRQLERRVADRTFLSGGERRERMTTHLSGRRRTSSAA